MRTSPAENRPKPVPAPADALPATHSVLDLACGLGSISGSLELPGQVFACGMDLYIEPMLHGRRQGSTLHFVQANAEQLPFKNESFDYVVSGVALPLMDIPVALREVRRTLTPGGRFWASLHPIPFAGHDFIRAVRSLNWKNMIFRPYVLLNGLVFHLTGRVFRFPLQRARCESFQSKRGMKLALEAAGFELIEMKRWGWYFTVLARAKSVSVTTS